VSSDRNADRVHRAGPSPADFAVPLDETLDGHIGLVTDELTPEFARGHVEVTNRTRQRWGLVHGGLYATLAELLASEATSEAVWGDARIAMGLSNHTSFLRPTTSGTVYAEARRRHRGSTTWVWHVDLTDDEGRLCAVSVVTMAVRVRPGEPVAQSGSAQ
jgi:1,4-dihydroxy-2-naphthoyl-CoA hydrolase